MVDFGETRSVEVTQLKAPPCQPLPASVVLLHCGRRWERLDEMSAETFWGWRGARLSEQRNKPRERFDGGLARSWLPLRPLFGEPVARPGVNRQLVHWRQPRLRLSRLDVEDVAAALRSQEERPEALRFGLRLKRPAALAPIDCPPHYPRTLGAPSRAAALKPNLDVLHARARAARPLVQREDHGRKLTSPVRCTI